MNRRDFSLSLCAAFSLAAPQIARASVKPISFATWNIACGAEKYHGRGFEGIAEFINENAIDVCVMQEVDRHARTSGYLNFPNYFFKQTGLYPFYAPASIEPLREGESRRREYGNLILSRWPLMQTHVVNLKEPYQANDPEWGVDNRIGLIARSHGICWATTHLSYIPGFHPHPIPKTQADNLWWHLSELVPGNMPLVLGGDFNSPPGSPNLASLDANLHCETKDLPPTWPLDYTQAVQNPTMTLDHIFTRAIRAEKVRTIPLEELSDHAVVMADIIPDRFDF